MDSCTNCHKQELDTEAQVFFSVVGYGRLHLSFCDITECLHSLVFMHGDPIIADVQVLIVTLTRLEAGKLVFTSLGIFY